MGGADTVRTKIQKPDRWLRKKHAGISLSCGKVPVTIYSPFTAVDIRLINKIQLDFTFWLNFPYRKRSQTNYCQKWPSLTSLIDWQSISTQSIRIQPMNSQLTSMQLAEPRISEFKRNGACHCSNYYPFTNIDTSFTISWTLVIYLKPHLIDKNLLDFTPR